MSVDQGSQGCILCVLLLVTDVSGPGKSGCILSVLLSRQTNTLPLGHPGDALLGNTGTVEESAGSAFPYSCSPFHLSPSSPSSPPPPPSPPPSVPHYDPSWRGGEMWVDACVLHASAGEQMSSGANRQERICMMPFWIPHLPFACLATVQPL